MSTPSEKNWEKLFEQLPLRQDIDAQQQQALKSDVLEVYETSTTSQPSHRLHQLGHAIMKYKIPHWTALTLLVVLALWMIPYSGPQALAVDQVVDNFVKAKTARFDLTVSMAGLPDQKWTAYYRSPGQFRQELGDAAVIITDWDQAKSVTLNPAVKQATVINFKGLTPEKKQNGAMNDFEKVRDALIKAVSNSNTQVETLAPKNFNGVNAVGYTFNSGPQKLTVWADPKDKLPVQIESIVSGPPEVKTVMSNYQFDIELDDALFSTKVPNGYITTESEIDLSPATEQDFLAALTTGSPSGSEFPTSFDPAGVGSYVGRYMATQLGNPPTQPSKETLQQVSKLARGLSFPTLLPKDADAHYAGKGVKASTEKSPIFWYKPAASEKYRIIAADLSVSESEDAPTINDAVSVGGLE